MSTTKPRLLTADDLLRLDSEGVRGELVRGVLCETMPAGRRHGRIQAKLIARLLVFVEAGKFGFVVGETGVWMERDPDTVRAPDMAYFSNERVPPEDRTEDAGYSDVPPDLAVEVVSPSDSRRAVHDKALMWRQHGVRLVWVVHPDTRTVDVHAEGRRVSTLTEDDALDGLDVLPGFTCPMREIFEAQDSRLHCQPKRLPWEGISRMSTTKPRLLTADDLLRLDSEGVRGELVRGVLCETMPAGRRHGRIQAKLSARLLVFVEAGKFGFVVGETGVWMERDPDTVRAPDMAYFSNERVPTEDRTEDAGYSDVAPDLAVEVVSPSDSRRAAHDNALMWRHYGVRLLWVVHPDTRTVDVHAEGRQVATLTEDDALDGLDVLPGFTCPVREIFEG